jgi:hypothetical protein
MEPRLRDSLLNEEVVMSLHLSLERPIFFIVILANKNGKGRKQLHFCIQAKVYVTTLYLPLKNTYNTDLSFKQPLKNSLIIHKGKTKEIATMSMVLYVIKNHVSFI